MTTETDSPNRGDVIVCICICNWIEFWKWVGLVYTGSHIQFGRSRSTHKQSDSCSHNHTVHTNSQTNATIQYTHTNSQTHAPTIIQYIHTHTHTHTYTQTVRLMHA